MYLHRLLIIDTVVNVIVFFSGIDELRGMSLTNKPPRVSSPRLSGRTSSSTMSLTSPVNAALDGGSHCHNLIRIDLGRRLFAEYVGDGTRDYRRTRLAADEDDFINILWFELRVPKSFLARLNRRVN